MHITIREGHDFVMDISSECSLLHLLVISSGATVANVISDGVVEQHGILGNHADMSSQRCLFHLRKDDEKVISSLDSVYVCVYIYKHAVTVILKTRLYDFCLYY